jgi:hypothetical protein
MVSFVKIIKALTVPLLIATVILGGCSQSAENQQTPVKPVVEAPINPLDQEGILTLLSEAAKIDNEFYAQKSHTKDEVYAHYESHFTSNYINRIVFEGGNVKNQGDQWVIAHEGGEILEGTFINQIDQHTMKSELSEDRKTITVTNAVGDGLYAPHNEVITIVHTDGGWKIDNLEWID